MRDKVILALLILMSSIATYLFIQNIQLSKKLEKYISIEEAEKIKPKIPPTKPANPPDVSPFDKPNNDPNADQFVPPSKDTLPATIIAFQTKDYNFGHIREGQLVNTTFKFTNVGNKPLTILQAVASCGCTVPTWPHQPLKAGESGEILVQFDSHDKKGEVTKTVSVTANTIPPLNTLTIKATVVPRE